MTGRTRSAVIAILLWVSAVAVVLLTIGSGSLPVSPAGVLSAIRGTADGGASFAVMEIGLPRGLLAILLGASLGMSGSLVQALTRNPLGSPDIIGFEAGAATAAVAAMLIWHATGWTITGAAVGGGAITAFILWWLSRGGGDMPYQLVLIGIGIASMLTGVTSYLLTRASFVEGLNAAKWLAGSLNSATWADVRISAVAVLVLAIAAALTARPLRAYLLGPELAVGVGVSVARLSGIVLLFAVALSGVAVSLAGPITFVALATPHLVARLIRTPGPHVLACAAGGAALLTLSDMLAQRVVLDSSLPVGIVTGALGGVFLAWLLAGRWRKEQA